MFSINIANCNNISNGTINVKSNYLNIYFAINGTGKSTIAKSIKNLSNSTELDKLKSYDFEDVPSCTSSIPINNVLLFDEDFVSTLVFKESEVLQNSFEVFIKDQEYEAQQQNISTLLKSIYIDISENQDITRILNVTNQVKSKFPLTQNGDFRNSGLLKSITSSESIFQLPETLKKYQPMMDKEYNGDWVGWKHDGGNFDDNGICPFCTSKLLDSYIDEKEIFTNTYTKSNVKNIRETLSFFDLINDFLNEEKKDAAYKCLKEGKDETTIKHWIRQFYNDLDYLEKKFQSISHFNAHKFTSTDISELDKHVESLKISDETLSIINNEKIQNLINQINQIIDKLLADILTLKKAFGKLNGLTQSSIKDAVTDINDFLFIAGINYQFEINTDSEGKAKSFLKYITKNDNEITIDQIDKHLSWGERNSFALVLFMHFALSKSPDLIILDDPISSFDNNKKYAIINRLFSKHSKNKSFNKKTTLLLTHDFQPIIDYLLINNKHYDYVTATFLENEDGIINEIEIKKEDVLSTPIRLLENSKNDNLNIVHRITCLRKYIEHTTHDFENDIAYNLLSCLLKCETNPTYKDKITLIQPLQMAIAEQRINNFIPGFDYQSCINNKFNTENLLSIYSAEMNIFFKIQIFRVLIGALNLRKKIEEDNNALLKYVDEQFHIENDYIYFLDPSKYNTVPVNIIRCCDNFLKNEGYNF
jgi:ABC-type dipeptide/oligopeptide/nickel transport system ATPase subunit